MLWSTRLGTSRSTKQRRGAAKLDAGDCNRPTSFCREQHHSRVYTSSGHDALSGRSSQVTARAMSLAPAVVSSDPHLQDRDQRPRQNVGCQQIIRFRVFPELTWCCAIFLAPVTASSVPSGLTMPVRPPAPARRRTSRRSTEVTLVCPRCGHVDRMSAVTYADWPHGIRCGVCDPPHVRMRAFPNRPKR